MENSVFKARLLLKLQPDIVNVLIDVYHLFTTSDKWPKYSDRVLSALKSGNILGEWDTFIMETSYFILRYHDIRKAAEYDEIGRLVCTRYPCVKFEEHGKNPWNHFVKRLSQKIRNIRWTRKRKLQEATAGTGTTVKRVALESANYDVEDDSTPEELKTKLIEEARSDNPDKAKIAKLQKQTFPIRNKEKPSFKLYPFLLEEKFVKKEFHLHLPVSNETLIENWNNVMQQLRQLAKEDNLETTENELDVLRFLENQIAATKRMKSIQPAISVENNTYVPRSHTQEAPRLVIIQHEDGDLSNGFVLHDGHVIEVTDATDLLQMVIFLCQCYYAWDLTYPTQYQLLGFCQLHILGDKKSPFKRSSNFMKFEKRLLSVTEL